MGGIRLFFARFGKESFLLLLPGRKCSFKSTTDLMRPPISVERGVLALRRQETVFCRDDVLFSALLPVVKEALRVERLFSGAGWDESWCSL